jgi:hypothetical protein
MQACDREILISAALFRADVRLGSAIERNCRLATPKLKKERVFALASVEGVGMDVLHHLSSRHLRSS